MRKYLSKTDVIVLILAFACLIFSEVLWFNGDRQDALFVGLWVPSILGFGVYLKVMKIARK